MCRRRPDVGYARPNLYRNKDQASPDPRDGAEGPTRIAISPRPSCWRGARHSGGFTASRGDLTSACWHFRLPVGSTSIGFCSPSRNSETRTRKTGAPASENRGYSGPSDLPAQELALRQPAWPSSKPGRLMPDSLGWASEGLLCRL
jgi:hypothetical protein